MQASTAFDLDQLVGSSFDVFHQIPALQRSTLAALTGAHTSYVKMGEATLRIIANPVVDGPGTRVGTVVQWLDRTQEVATREEVQAIVGQGDRRGFDARAFARRARKGSSRRSRAV